jgi:hypothetical protein
MTQSTRRRPRTARLILLTVACLALADTGAARYDRLVSMPDRVVWAWERPEDLKFVDPGRAAVAVLDRTIVLSADAIDVRLRRQPLRLQPHTRVIAVVRIEGSSTALSAWLRDRTVRAIAAAAGRGVRAVQIDFDATFSQRPMYEDLLRDVRAAIPGWMPLGITALTSWCSERWVDTLPIDEAVPMLFRMGVDGPDVRRRLSRREPFVAGRCATSLGLSTDEPIDLDIAGRRVYLFHPRPWTRGALDDAEARLR